MTSGDPVSTATGTFHYQLPLISWQGPVPLDFKLIYRPDALQINYGMYDQIPSTCGFVTTSTTRILVRAGPKGGEEAYVAFPDRLLTFKGERGRLSATHGVAHRIQRLGNRCYLMDVEEEKVYVFVTRKVKGRAGAALTGVLTAVWDRMGNGLRYTYGKGDLASLPVLIEDGLGRRLELTYTTLAGRPLLSQVTDFAGRTVKFGYASKGRLVGLTSLTGPDGGVYRFEYQRPFAQLKRVMLPKGNFHTEQAWTKAPLNQAQAVRVSSQKDAYSQQTRFVYDPKSPKVGVIQPGGCRCDYEHLHSRWPKTYIDAAGNQVEHKRNRYAQIVRVVNRNGGITSYTYHPASRKLESITNPRGQTKRFVYKASSQDFNDPATKRPVTFTFYSLAKVEYPDGGFESFKRDGRGNVVFFTDRAGKSWSYTYDLRGQVLTQVNPLGGTTAMGYNPDGTLAWRQDSDTGRTTYAYDPAKRAVKVRDPLGGITQMAYDPAGRLLAVTNPRGGSRQFKYDANGNLIQVQDPDGKKTVYAHDLMDRPTAITDKLGHTRTMVYDAQGNLAVTRDPTGLTRYFNFDDRGWLASVTMGGQTWRMTYDKEGAKSMIITPLGNATTMKNDMMGLRQAVVDPEGNETSYTYDAGGRLIKTASKELGTLISHRWDRQGHLEASSRPQVGEATYINNQLGLVMRLNDLDGRPWSFTYSAMGRPLTMVDPLGHTWRFAYDKAGRLQHKTYPQGDKLVYERGPGGRIKARRHSGGQAQKLAYDGLGRLVQVNKLQLTRDPEGRIIASTRQGVAMGAAYDAGGRLASVSYLGGALKVSYAYDPVTGLLASVGDSLAQAKISFTYDRDRQLIAVERSNGVSTRITRDAAGRVVGLRDKGVLDLRYTLDAAGRVSRLSGQVPLDPSAHLDRLPSRAFAYDPASQLKGKGIAHDQRGRLTAKSSHRYQWDGFSRLAALDKIKLAYNGMGDPVLRQSPQGQLALHYNYALDTHPVMAETKADKKASPLRYYVWTPSGRLLYMIDAADGAVFFPHFDRTGNTLALTDAKGRITDAYAYDPFGNLLARQGGHSQPFTYVGQYGVRAEGDGKKHLIYHMRARFYDPDSGRFLSRERLWPALRDPLQLNPYQYALNEPVTTVDFTGLSPSQPGGNFVGQLGDLLGSIKNWMDFGIYYTAVLDDPNILKVLGLGAEEALPEYLKGWKEASDVMGYVTWGLGVANQAIGGFQRAASGEGSWGGQVLVLGTAVIQHSPFNIIRPATTAVDFLFGTQTTLAIDRTFELADPVYAEQQRNSWIERKEQEGTLECVHNPSACGMNPLEHFLWVTGGVLGFD